MGLFPPVMIGHGEAAWRVCQKYVANQPLSALVLMDGPSLVDASTLPSFEFEPYFPIMLMSEKVPPFLLKYGDEVDVLSPAGNNEEALLTWIDETA
ncbi:hypothetical protein BX666DRAFT_1922308 [Dichotomocladium elegans]|nr:hypothetical protein BX666DRAFT_1922308 [Dichotomocladium elegans]